MLSTLAYATCHSERPSRRMQSTRLDRGNGMAGYITYIHNAHGTIMSDPSYKKADAYIEHDGRDLRTIFTKIAILDELNRKIQAYLDPVMGKYCQVANLFNGKLTLLAANASIATQIRFQSIDLIIKFSQDPTLKHIVSLECKVRLTQPLIPARLAHNEHKHMAELSPKTAEMVSAIAETISDPRLSEVMARIATRIKGKNEG
jgi:hypothetical protein